MEFRRVCKWIVISGAVLIWTIKYGVRPFYDLGQPVNFILGIAPNLLGSFLIPFAVYWVFSGKEFMIARVFQIHSVVQLRIVCLLGFGMLIVNEYLQLIPVFGRTFDYYDILFSAFGLSIAYIMIDRFYKQELYSVQR